MCQWCSWWAVPAAMLRELEPSPADEPRHTFEAVAIDEAKPAAPEQRSDSE